MSINPAVQMSTSSQAFIVTVAGGVTAIDLAALGGVTRVEFSTGTINNGMRVAYSTTGTPPDDPAVPGTASAATNEFMVDPREGLTLDQSLGKDKGYDKITDIKMITDTDILVGVQTYG